MEKNMKEIGQILIYKSLETDNTSLHFEVTYIKGDYQVHESRHDETLKQVLENVKNILKKPELREEDVKIFFNTPCSGLMCYNDSLKGLSVLRFKELSKDEIEKFWELAEEE